MLRCRGEPLLSSSPPSRALQLAQTAFLSLQDPETQAITDFASFYSLPSTNIGSVKYPILNAAYTFYYASSAAFSPSSEAGSSTEVASSSKSRNLALGDQLRRLMGDLLVVAKAVSLLPSLPCLQDLG